MAPAGTTAVEGSAATGELGRCCCDSIPSAVMSCCDRRRASSLSSSSWITTFDSDSKRGEGGGAAVSSEYSRGNSHVVTAAHSKNCAIVQDGVIGTRHVVAPSVPKGTVDDDEAAVASPPPPSL